MSAADDEEAVHVDSSRLWEHRRSRIKALDDKFRWKLNELGVRRRTSSYLTPLPGLAVNFINH